MKRIGTKLAWAGAACLVFATLSGCSGGTVESGTTQSKQGVTPAGAGSSSASGSAQTESPAAGASNGSSQGKTRIMKDAKGEVTIPAEPKRIADVSGSTEELLALGFRPVISGNTDMQNPQQLTPLLKEKLGQDVAVAGWFQNNVSIEAIVAASPDLILVGPAMDKIYDQLSKIAPTVRVPYGFNAFRERFAFVAGTLDKKAEQEKWMAAYESRAKQLREQLAAATVKETFAVIEATAKEIRIYAKTGVADLVFNDLSLPQAPGTPQPDPWGGKVASLEGLSTLNPDHIVLLSDSKQNVLEESTIWANLKAVKAGKVYRMTTRQNYNEAFFAMGKQQLLEQLAGEIKKGNP